MAYRRRLKKKARMEFSKLILIVAAIVNLAVVVFTFIMIWRTNDLSPLTYLIPAVAAETATGTGFYYAKAKVENRIKLMKANRIEPTAESFNEGGSYNG